MKKQNNIIHIGIDGNEANRENRVGVNTYAYEVLSSLYSITESNKSYTFTIFLQTDPLAHMPLSREGWSYEVLPGKGLWVIRQLTPALFTRRHSLNVFWSPSHYLPPVSVIPLVCSVMDLGYLESASQFTRKDFWQLKYWTAWSLKIARKVVAISEATRKDIVRHYPFTREKLVTTLLGYDQAVFNTHVAQSKIEAVRKRYQLSDYVLFMSTLKPSKNIVSLLHSWKLIFHDFPSYKLVIAGKKGWLFNEIFETVKNLNLEDSVVFTDFVAETDKAPLISGAKVFVLPSLWEGFGIDVLSAMACGVPVVVSDRGSLLEVAGGAGIIVNPESVEDIARGMTLALSADKKESEARILKGLAQAKKFSWDKTARETLALLVETAAD